MGKSFSTTLKFLGVKIFLFINIINLCGYLQKDKITIESTQEKNNKHHQTTFSMSAAMPARNVVTFKWEWMWNRDTNWNCVGEK